MTKKSAKQSFLEGAVVLIIANALVKIIGAVFKLPLTNLIGKDGISIFSQAYNIYSALFILSTAGLPVAVSKMVAEANALGRPAEVKKIVRTAFLIFTFIGAACSLVLIFGAHTFAQMVGDEMAYFSMVCIGPALFFVAVMSTIRGYFQGMSNMVPTAISQVIEALFKLIAGSLFAYVLMRRGYGVEIAAAGAIAGVTIGTVFGALYLVIKLIRSPLRFPIRASSLETSSNSSILTRLIKISIPITIGASVLSVTNLIDMFLVMNRLQDAGFSVKAARGLYGAYNMALNLFNVPQALIVAISISIIPAIASAFVRRDFHTTQRTMESALRITALLALPCAAGLAILAEPILKFLYYKQLEDAALAAPLLMLLGGAVLFVALVSITNSLLQSLGKVNIPVATMLAGGAVKLVTNYLLVGDYDTNIHGAPIGTTLCYGTIAVLNLMAIVKTTGVKLPLGRIFLKPLAATAVMGVCAWFLYPALGSFMGRTGALLVTIAVCVAVYGMALVLVKAITYDDVRFLPKGEKIARILRIK